MWPFFRRGLRVLMYHRASISTADRWTVTTAQLLQQVQWLRHEGYAFVTIAEMISAIGGRIMLPERSILLTFDDAYMDTLAIAKPVLDACGVGAAVFVPTAFVGRSSAWDNDARPLMDAAQLRTLSASGWELGLHSHRHVNYRALSAAEIADDIRACFSGFQALGVAPQPALAYPYGGRPAGHGRKLMQHELRASGVRAGFRIGGRVNRLPLGDAFEINRIDVRGDRSFPAFVRSVRAGRF